MRVTRLLIAAGLALLVAAGASYGRDLEKKSVTVESEGARKLDIQFHFGAGQLHLQPADQEAPAKLDISYDDRYYDHTVDYKVVDGTGRLDIDSKHESHESIDTDDNKWDVTLSDRYPTSLSLDIGACDADMELGGIPLTHLDVDVGAASAEFHFSKPNPNRAEEIRMKAGASSLDMTDIGNANFDQFDFDGGVGSYDLDFRGEYNGESRIKLHIGLGSGDITLPRGVACRVEENNPNFLSSVDLHGSDLDEVEDHVYETPDFDKAKTRIILELEVGVGSVDIYFK